MNTEKPVGQTTPVIVARFADSTCSSWRFPDGTVVYGIIKASEKAKSLGMELEVKSTGRFSRWH